MSSIFAEYGIDQYIIISGVVVAALIFIKLSLLTPAAAPVAEKKQKQKKKKAAPKKKKTVVAAEPVLNKAQRKKQNKRNAKLAAAAAEAEAAAAAAVVVESEPEEEVKQVVAPSKKKKNKKKKASATPAPVPVVVAAVPEPEVVVVEAAISKNKKKKQKAKAKKVEQQQQQQQQQANTPQQDADEGWETVKKTSRPSHKAAAAAAVVQSTNGNTDDSEEDSKQKLNIVKEDMAVETQFHGVIIGQGGCHLKALQEGTDTQIDMPKRDTASKWVVLKGEPANIVLVKRAIKSLIEKGYCKYTHPDMTDQAISVPENKRSVVIGAKGANIKAIQHATNVKIQMPDRDSASNKVVIVGELAEVKMARGIIRQLLETGFSDITHPGFVREEIVDFPFNRVGLVIGHKGQTIKSIQGNTNTKINTPRSEGEPLVIIGPIAGVQQAKKEIERVLNPPEAIIPTVQQLEEETDNDWATLDDELVEDLW